MSGDIHQDKDQERFEDYLELEHFIEELQAGHTAHPPTELTPDKAQIYRMAALFRSVSPDEVTPRPEFAAELQARLEQELQQPPKTRHFPFISKKPQTKPRVSRRAILAGGAAVAASLTLGAGIDHMVEQATQPATGGSVADNYGQLPLSLQTLPRPGSSSQPLQSLATVRCALQLTPLLVISSAMMVIMANHLRRVQL